jgi:hypothetical protein
MRHGTGKYAFGNPDAKGAYYEGAFKGTDVEVRVAATGSHTLAQDIETQKQCKTPTYTSVMKTSLSGECNVYQCLNSMLFLSRWYHCSDSFMHFCTHTHAHSPRPPHTHTRHRRPRTARTRRPHRLLPPITAACQRARACFSTQTDRTISV